MRKSLILLPAALILAGCGGGDTSSDTTESPEVSNVEPDTERDTERDAEPTSGNDSGQTEPEPRTPIDVAEDLGGEVDSITQFIEINEDNDPNDLIGRPGGYAAAVVVTDDRVRCKDLGADCGATIEQFETAEAAQGRSDYIQGLLGADGPLGTEYNYVDGDLLLRVTGELKPSEAAAYEAAFTG